VNVEKVKLSVDLVSACWLNIKIIVLVWSKCHFTSFEELLQLS